MLRPLPPDCVERDFTGACTDALLYLIRMTPAEKVKQGILAVIAEHGATHNQRTLIRNACLSLYVPADGQTNKEG